MDSIKQYLDQFNLEDNQGKVIDEDQFVIANLVDELLFKCDKQINLNQANSNQINSNCRTKLRRNKDEIKISSDEDSDSIDDDSDNELDKCFTRLKPLKTKGELLIEELPAPEHETIQLTLGVDELQQIGSINKILDNLVIVESFKNLPALDLESLLFFRDGRSIGRVFDVIGPVIKPFYVIRFSNHQQILDNLISINMPIYFVPKYQDLTRYVLISQLKGVKGSDASWEHNNEPPANVKEYSDDEEERRENLKSNSKRKKNGNRRGFNPRFNTKSN